MSVYINGVTKMSENTNKTKTLQNPLGEEKIPKLVAKYAIPSVISMLINAVYNIVDQIFLGHGVGFLGNTATNIALPFVTLSLAVSLLIGVGCSSYINLSLGRSEKEEASRAFCSSFILAFVFGVGLAALGLIFLKPLVYLFGATENSAEYAMQYMAVIAIGMPFNMPAILMNNAIRADGSPTYSMISISTGAILNCILDPLFIFVFKWGVFGAALATITGQIVSFILSLVYIKRFKTLEIKKEYFTLKSKCLKNVLHQGTSNFINQMSIVLVQVVMNNSLRVWGAQSIYGSDICLAALGVAMKVNNILISAITGIAIGQQPIVGYNYGAKKYDRAFEAYRFSAICASVLAVIGWGIFMLFPDKVVQIFGQEEALYSEFASMCINIVLAAVFLAGFQITTSNMFQAIGKPNLSAVLTLLRQPVVIVPLILILPRFFGVKGILYASSVTDVISFVFAVIFLLAEIKDLKEKIAQNEASAK